MTAGGGLPSLVSRLSFLVSRLSFLVSRFSSLVSRLSSLVSRLSSLVSRRSPNSGYNGNCFIMAFTSFAKFSRHAFIICMHQRIDLNSLLHLSICSSFNPRGVTGRYANAYSRGYKSRLIIIRYHVFIYGDVGFSKNRLLLFFH